MIFDESISIFTTRSFLKCFLKSFLGHDNATVKERGFVYT